MISRAKIQKIPVKYSKGEKVERITKNTSWSFGTPKNVFKSSKFPNILNLYFKRIHSDISVGIVQAPK